MISSLRTIGILVAAVIILAGCAARNRPILYPNEKLSSVGRPVAERDIDECIMLAQRQGVRCNQGGKIAKRSAVGAATGAATGAVVGAFTGNAGRNAAAGAAGGATAALLHGLFYRDNPNPTYRRFVEICLRDKGYQLVGWQ